MAARMRGWMALVGSQRAAGKGLPLGDNTQTRPTVGSRGRVAPDALGGPGNLKKLMTGDEVTELLSSLEMGGEPVWGLSTKERRLVREAKEKIHAV